MGYVVDVLPGLRTSVWLTAFYQLWISVMLPVLCKKSISDKGSELYLSEGTGKYLECN